MEQAQNQKAFLNLIQVFRQLVPNYNIIRKHNKAYWIGINFEKINQTWNKVFYLVSDSQTEKPKLSAARVMLKSTSVKLMNLVTTELVGFQAKSSISVYLHS